MPQFDPFNPMETAQQIIAARKMRTKNNFLLTWEGSKIPRGAKIDDVAIGWTQHGVVTGVDGSELGFYDRLVEFGGDSGKMQVMMISTNGEALTPPADGSCQKITIAAAPAAGPSPQLP